MIFLQLSRAATARASTARASTALAATTRASTVRDTTISHATPPGYVTSMHSNCDSTNNAWMLKTLNRLKALLLEKDTMNQFKLAQFLSLYSISTGQEIPL